MGCGVGQWYGGGRFIQDAAGNTVLQLTERLDNCKVATLGAMLSGRILDARWPVCQILLR